MQCLLAACVALPLSSQQPAPLHAVRGVVYDSVSHAPLAGAVVELASRDTIGRPVTATTDAAGRYRIAGLPAGQYVLGFHHEALDALGLDDPVRLVHVGPDTLVTADLAIPSGTVVRALRCGDDSSSSGTGMLAGLVRDASNGEPLAGATVTVEWMALVLEADNFRNARQRAAATAGVSGAYRGCDLPADAPLDLIVRAPGHRPLAGQVVVPAGSVARLDIALADSAAEHGRGIITGRVVRENGKVVTAGRALIAALGRDVPVQDGAFVLADLPAGTWVVEARVIGAEPQSALVTTTGGAAVATTLTIDDRAQRLDAVTVVGKPDRNTRTLTEIIERQRSSFGTAFLPGSWQLASASRPIEVMRFARGFRQMSSTQVCGRAHGIASCCTNVAVYINGAIFSEGFAGLDAVLQMHEVLAIETYPDVLFAPVQWRGNLGLDATSPTGKSPHVCAVVVVWTKH